MIKFFGITRDQSVLEIAYNSKTDKVIIPDDVVGYHEETEEFLG